MNAYKQIRLGDPLKEGTLCGPLHTKSAVKEYLEGLKTIQSQGGKILVGGKQIEGEGNFVEPTIVEIAHDAPIVKEEIFAPIMYAIKCNVRNLFKILLLTLFMTELRSSH